jgi:hypothetical protein
MIEIIPDMPAGTLGFRVVGGTGLPASSTVPNRSAIGKSPSVESASFSETCRVASSGPRA